MNPLHSLTPKTLALDGSLLTWVAFVLGKGVTGMIAAATLVLLVLRVLIAIREYRKLGE